MGNMFSEESFRVIELYKWSSAEFPQEYALIYSSLNDKSRFSIFRLSVKPEKVLLRLADSLCDDHPVRLHMEFIAERDNGYYNYRAVRVVEYGTILREIPFSNYVAFISPICQRRVGGWNVERHGGRYNKLIWEVLHSYALGFKTHIRFYGNIECDKVNGLSVKFKGPFKCEGLVFETKSDSLIQREVHGEPPKDMIRIVESDFRGKQFVLFNQGKVNSLTDDEQEEQLSRCNTFSLFLRRLFSYGMKYLGGWVFTWCNIPLLHK